jgi:hypothetical protein
MEAKIRPGGCNLWENTAAKPKCLLCKAPLCRTFVDLGMSPLCESYLAADQVHQMEPFYPLHVKVCEKCYLVQLEEYVSPEHIFTFPHLVRLTEENQFDTIYHEHFSYFSLITVEKIFAAHGLLLFDVDEIPNHGGSIRIYLRHVEDGSKPVMPSVLKLRARELALGLDRMDTYANFAEQVVESKRSVVGVAHSPAAPRESTGGVWRSWKREYTTQLLRHPDGLFRIHGGSEPIQTGTLFARYPHSYSLGGTHTRTAAGFHPYPSVEPEG